MTAQDATPRVSPARGLRLEYFNGRSRLEVGVGGGLPDAVLAGQRQRPESGGSRRSGCGSEVDGVLGGLGDVESGHAVRGEDVSNDGPRERGTERDQDVPGPGRKAGQHGGMLRFSTKCSRCPPWACVVTCRGCQWWAASGSVPGWP